MAVYMTNILFNDFENLYMIKSFRLLHFDYKSSNQNLIVENLLNKLYKVVKSQIMQCLNVCNYLNFFTNKTTNIREERIINLYCHVSSNNDFYLKAIASLVEKINAVTQTK